MKYEEENRQATNVYQRLKGRLKKRYKLSVTAATNILFVRISITKGKLIFELPVSPLGVANIAFRLSRTAPKRRLSISVSFRKRIKQHTVRSPNKRPNPKGQ